MQLYGISKSRWYAWRKFGITKNPKKVNLHAPLPEEVQQVLEFRKFHQGVGYRKFTHMLNDANQAYFSESAILRILKANNMLEPKISDELNKTGKEYKEKPIYVHQHWHMDIAYVKIRGIFYFLIMMLDGYSRFLLDWELMPDMLGSSVEAFVQRVREKYSNCSPKLITDNGCQFVSRDFKALLHQIDIQQIRTRRNHPQTNGKIERMNGSVKHEALFPNAPQSYSEAVQILHEYDYFYNYQRLHAGISFVRPADVFFGRQKQILTTRKNNVTLARQLRVEANRLNAKFKHVIPSLNYVA